jgi:hypothetical protein
MISVLMIGSSLSIWPKAKNASRISGLLARCWRVGIALCLATFWNLDIAQSQTIKVNTLKQITFHKMNYNFEQFYCLDEIIFKESRWNYKAKNPKSSAYGLFQMLKSKESDPVKQIDNGLRYINHRYNGCACTALAHHKAKGWY